MAVPARQIPRLQNTWRERPELHTLGALCLWSFTVLLIAYLDARMLRPHAAHVGTDRLIVQVAFAPEAVYFGKYARAADRRGIGYVHGPAVENWSYLMRLVREYPSGLGIDHIVWGRYSVLRLAWPLLFFVVGFPATLSLILTCTTDATARIPGRTHASAGSSTLLDYASRGHGPPGVQPTPFDHMLIRVTWGLLVLAAVPLVIDIANGWRADVPAWALLASVFFAGGSGLIAACLWVNGRLRSTLILRRHGLAAWSIGSILMFLA